MKLNYLQITALLSLSLMCSNLFAVGWKYKFDFAKGSHWGSSPVTTSYNKLTWTISQNVGLTRFKIQQKINGTWKDHKDFKWGSKNLIGKGTKTYTINANPKVEYRVFISATTLSSEGTISYKAHR